MQVWTATTRHEVTNESPLTKISESPLTKMLRKSINKDNWKSINKDVTEVH